MNAQDKDLEQNKLRIEADISKAKQGERLMLMDSLADYIAYDTNFESDSIVRATIELAKELDSINILVRQTSSLINFLNYKSGQLDEAKQIIEDTKSLLPLVTDRKILSKYFYETADLYYYSGDFDNSLSYFDSSYVYSVKYDDVFTGISKLGKGIIYTDKGEFGKASFEIQEAIRYYQVKKDTIKWIDAKSSMAILYSKNGFYEDATKEREEQIELAKQLKSYNNLQVIYYNAAADLNKLGLQKERISNLKHSIKANETSDNKGFLEPILKFGLAVAYAENDSLALAEELVKVLEVDLEKNTTGFKEGFYLEAKKKIAFAKKDFKKAADFGETYLKLKNEGKQYEEIQEGENFLYQVYEAIGQNEKAFTHYKNYTKIKDSIGDVKKSRALAYYQTLYETEKRDLTIKTQESDIALLDSKNKIKNQWLFFGSLGLLSLFVFFTLIRSRNFAKRKQKLQEVFTQDIIKTQEDERTRVALELHDSVGQQLMLLTRKSKAIGDKNLQDLANDALGNLRSISQGLHPVVLERLGFTSAVEDLLNDIDEQSDLFFTSEIENIDQYLNQEQALHLYRIIQENLNNILKHANAKAVFITIASNKNLISVKIKDNGKGFNYEHQLKTSKSLGLKSLAERCKIIQAEFQIKSEENIGTEITIGLKKTLE